MNNDILRNQLVDSVLQNMNMPVNSHFRTLIENMLTNYHNSANQNSSGTPPNYSINIGGNNFNLNDILGNINLTQLSEQNQENLPPLDTSISSNVVQTEDDIIVEDLSETLTDEYNTTEENVIQSPTNIEEENTQENVIPPAPTVDIEVLKEKYKDQLEEIKNMGFENENHVLTILNSSNGSVSIALNRLLG